MTYDGFDDYTLAHITGDDGVEVYADVFFDATVAPFDSSVTSEMQTALAEKYQGSCVTLWTRQSPWTRLPSATICRCPDPLFWSKRAS